MSNIKWEAFGNEAIGRVEGKIKYVCCPDSSSNEYYQGFELNDELGLVPMISPEPSVGIVMAKVENHHDKQTKKEDVGKFVSPIRS